MDGFMENPIYKWMIWGYPDFRKPLVHDDEIVLIQDC